MSIQTSVAADPSVAYEGLIFGSGASDRAGYIVSETAGISPGRFVAQGSSDGTCILPAASTDITGNAALGVAVFDPTLPTNWPASSYTVQYHAGQACQVLRKGRIWVYAEEAVTPASSVYVRYASGSLGTVLGRFGDSGTDTSTRALLPNARFCTSTTAAGLVLLEINLPG